MEEHLKSTHVTTFEAVQLNRRWTKGLRKSWKLETVYREPGGRTFRKRDICMGISWFVNAHFLAAFQSNMLTLTGTNFMSETTYVVGQ